MTTSAPAPSTVPRERRGRVAVPLALHAAVAAVLVPLLPRAVRA